MNTNRGAERSRVQVPAEVARRLPPSFEPRAFRSPQLLARHFAKHSSDFPGLTEAQYQQRAVELLRQPVGGSVLGMTLGNGMVYRYDTRTRELAVCGPTGVIRTLFKTSRGSWERRVQRAATMDFRRDPR